MSAFRNFLLTFLLGLLIFGILGFTMVKFTSAKLFGSDDRDPSLTDVSSDTQGADSPDDTEQRDGPNAPGGNIGGHSFSSLFVLTDYQPNVYDDYDVSAYNKTTDGFPKEPRMVKTPIILLQTIDREKGESMICAIPPDTKISLDGLPTTLDCLYAKKGIDALCSRVLAMTGLPIEYYAVMQPAQFSSMIDSLGEMSIYVEKVIDYAPTENATPIHLSRGTQKINGEKAVALLLNNTYKDGSATQRKIAVSFMRDFLIKNIDEAAADPDAALTSFDRFFEFLKETNFDREDFKNNMELIFSYNKMSITDYTYPGSMSGGTFSANVSSAIDVLSRYKFVG